VWFSERRPKDLSGAAIHWRRRICLEFARDASCATGTLLALSCFVERSVGRDLLLAPSASESLCKEKIYALDCTLIIGFSLVLALYVAAQETTDSRSIAYPEHQNKQDWILTFFRWSVRDTRDLDDSVAGSLLLLTQCVVGSGRRCECVGSERLLSGKYIHVSMKYIEAREVISSVCVPTIAVPKQRARPAWRSPERPPDCGQATPAKLQ
jgi:hypothetical protein